MEIEVGHDRLASLFLWADGLETAPLPHRLQKGVTYLIDYTQFAEFSQTLPTELLVMDGYPVSSTLQLFYRCMAFCVAHELYFAVMRRRSPTRYRHTFPYGTAEKREIPPLDLKWSNSLLSMLQDLGCVFYPTNEGDSIILDDWNYAIALYKESHKELPTRWELMEGV